MSNYRTLSNYNHITSFKPFVTFLVPSIGRPWLADTIASFYEQTMTVFNANGWWNALVVFDNVEPTISFKNNRIMPIKCKEKLGEGVNNAAKVRNYGLDFFKSYKENIGTDNTGIFIAFCDDDDRVTYDYIERLFTEYQMHPEADIIVFRMQYADGTVLPKDINASLESMENGVGISFACKKEVFNKIKFEPSNSEDFSFLMTAKKAGFNIHFSEHVTYLVSPMGCAPDRRPKN